MLNNMSWKAHIEKIVTKASRALNLIQRACTIFPRSTREKLYNSMVLPILDYGDILYDNAPFNIKEQLNKLHRKAAVMCTRAYRHTETTRLLQELGWLSLDRRRHMHKLTLFYKIKNHLTPPYLSSLCPPLVRDRVQGYRLRNTTNVTNTRWRTTRASNSYFPSTIVQWNALPLTLRNIPTFKQFKSQLKAINSVSSPHFFGQCDGYPAVLHTRLRLLLSGLDDHRFSYNLIENRYCQHCPRKIENNMHFFLDCPRYAAQRQTLVQSIGNILPEFTTTSKKHKLNLLLHGSPNINTHKNHDLQKVIESYIVETHRFDIITT
jgi:hypothetical protein